MYCIIYLSIYFSIDSFMCIYLYIYLSIYSSIIYLSVYMFICLSVCSCIYLFVYLFVFIYIYICLYLDLNSYSQLHYICFCWVLMRFWSDSDVILVCFQVQEPKQTHTKPTVKRNRKQTFDPHQNHKFDPYQNHNWNHIKIICAKPGQKQIIVTTNHIWNIPKRICWKTSILEASDVIIVQYGSTMWHKLCIYNCIEYHLLIVIITVFHFYLLPDNSGSILMGGAGHWITGGASSQRQFLGSWKIWKWTRLGKQVKHQAFGACDHNA